MAQSNATLAVSEADNGRSIQILRGERVLLVLHSTYWQLEGSGAPSILAAEGTPLIEAHRKECVPGGGCGTITQSFVGVAAGQAAITAERKVCGEALLCPPERRLFKVIVDVRDK